MATRIWGKYLEGSLPDAMTLAITANAVFDKAQTLEGVTPATAKPLGGFDEVPVALKDDA